MVDTAPVSPGGGNTIPVVQTSPEEITLHRIEDRELETMMGISRPYALAFGTMSVGAFLGLLPSVLAIWGRADAGLSNVDLMILMIAGGSLVAAAVLCGYAIRALVDANKALNKVRCRPKTPA